MPSAKIQITIIVQQSGANFPERKGIPRIESGKMRYEEPDREYAEEQPRRQRVYSDDSPESRTQSRRGFTPDVPSFMKKK